MVASVAAGALRLIDRALAAHGRDVGYSTDAWLDEAIASGHAIIELIASREPARVSLFQIVNRAAASAAGAIQALPRDRLAVPQALGDALADLLVIYAAASAPPSRPNRPALARSVQ